jgi:hypothetical protein
VKEREAATDSLTKRVETAILRGAQQEAMTADRRPPTVENGGSRRATVACQSAVGGHPPATREGLAWNEACRDVRAVLAAVRAIRRRNLWRFPTMGTWKKLLQYHGRPVLAHRLDDLAPAESAAILEEIERINQLEVSAAYHRWLRGWTTFHRALTLGLAQLILWHIYITTAY